MYNPLRSARLRTPTVLQMEAVECGAAALCIVLAYHGKQVPLEELRQSCGVSRDGSKASNVVRAARMYGMVAKGYRKEPAELKDLKLPLIVFWNFNHFLVVEGFHKGKVYLNDPASGPRVVSDEEFDQSFTGVVLSIEPGPDFQKGGQPPSLWRSLKQRIPFRDPAFTFLLIVGLCLVIPGLLLPVFTKVFIDNYLVGKMEGWIGPILIGLAVTAVVRGLLTWLQEYYLSKFRMKLAVAMSGRFFWHVLRLPVVFFSQRSAGDIGNRVGINDRVASLMTGEIASTLLSALMVVFYGALMLSYDIVLTLVSLGLVVINVAVLRVVSRKRKDSTQKLANDQGKLAAVSINGLQMIETIKASGLESDFFNKWLGYQTKVMNGHQKLASVDAILSGVPTFLTALNTAAILSLGSARVMDGYMTVGMLVAFQSLMSSFIHPFNQLVAMGAKIQAMAGDLNRLDDVLRYECDESTSAPSLVDSPAAITRLSGNIELRNVTFGFSPLDSPLLENFNLTLRPGMRVALVGRSGCGKSTVARLIMGLYKPWSGEILFDGKVREQHSRQTLISSMAVVSQELALFSGTIRDNLSMWDSTVSDSRLLQAAKDACIHDAIAARSGGYDSEVMEGGGNFSGGQRQRLEIARALAIEPRILVLDEATSALDPVTEMQVDDNLRRRGCTCIIVAHRLSTIRDCDEIIVMERGRIVERGTHADLLKSAGMYADLIREA